MKQPLTLQQGNEPLLPFRATTRLTDRSYQAINLNTVSAIRFLAKASNKASDASATVINGTPLEPSAAGRFTVQISSAVTANAGVFFYRVEIMVAGHPLTLRYGPLTVVNT
jgi:hypothetical protein